MLSFWHTLSFGHPNMLCYQSSLHGFFWAAKPTNSIDFADAWAWITVLFFASLACSTSYFALYASCWATCFASIASKYSLIKVRSVIAKLSIIILKCAALWVSRALILSETWSLCERSWLAENWATTVLRI